MQIPSDPIADRASEEEKALPVLFVVDHDANALDAHLTSLSRRFGNDFSVRGETSADSALAALQKLAAEDRAVALILVENALAEGLLPRAHKLHPEAKRVLLVDRDYSSSSPVVQEIALGRADYHLVRPWPSDEAMFRTMSEYLASWTAEREREPEFAEFRVVAAEHDSRMVRLRDVMNRFSIPFKFCPLESDAGRRLIDTAGLDADQLPALIRYDGQVTVDPGLTELAKMIGVQVTSDVDCADLAIVGAGPAGLTASVYAASEGLDTVLLERAVSGGQAGTSPMIRNYPGFPHGVEGAALMERTCEQAWLMGAHIVFAQRVIGLDTERDLRIVHLEDGTTVRATAVVLAPGVNWRRLGVPELEALVGAGVFYGVAASEAPAMHGQPVSIIGAGNSAGQAALHLAKHASTVTMLVRGESLEASMSSYLTRAIETTPNISVRLRTQVVGGDGGEQLESLQLEVADGSLERLPTAGLFIMIGGEPHTGWLPAEIVRDPGGYVVTGRDLLRLPDAQWTESREPLTLETSIPGVFVAGDVRHSSTKRVAAAVGDGATAVRLVQEYLREGITQAAAG